MTSSEDSQQDVASTALASTAVACTAVASTVGAAAEVTAAAGAEVDPDCDGVSTMPLRPAAPPADLDSTMLMPRVPRPRNQDDTVLIAQPLRRGPYRGGGRIFRSASSEAASEPVPLETKVDFREQPPREPRTHRKSRRQTARHSATGGNGAGGAGADGGPEDSDALDGEGKPTISPDGELIVPLRPVRTEEGYRSVYSHMTRRTVWTVLRTATRTSGELMITFGLIVLLFAAYEVWGVGAAVTAHQDELSNQLDQAWSPQPSTAATQAPQTTPIDGAAIARIYIQKIRTEPWTVVQGVTPADIKHAPGHYPQTAMPGEVGNFSVAGHRTLKIFWDLDKLQPGDQMVVETRETWFVYQVTRSHVVLPSAVSVIAPVPNKPGAKPTQAMMTLTTCNPKGRNYQRLIIHGQLVGQQPRADGPPAGVSI